VESVQLTESAAPYTIYLPLALKNFSDPKTLYVGCGGRNVPVFDDTFEQEVIVLVNQERSAHGLSALVRSQSLTNAARYHAADMAHDNYFDHDTYDRIDGQLTKRCGAWARISTYYSGANGENAAAGYGTPAAVMSGWMNSPGHKSNILNPSTTAIGVGYANGPGDYHHYWVQDFGTKP